MPACLFVRADGWTKMVYVDRYEAVHTVLECPNPAWAGPGPCRAHLDCRESVEIGLECARRQQENPMAAQAEQRVFYRYEFDRVPWDYSSRPTNRRYIYLEAGVTVEWFLLNWRSLTT